MRGFQEIMRELRDDNQYKQAEVAAALGISQQYYSKYETGEYELPVRHLVTLAKFYDVSADYLLGLTEFKGTFESLAIQAADSMTVGALLSDILSLSGEGLKSVAEYVQLMKIKQGKTN